MCRTIRIDPSEAARALRAIPSEKRSEASRLNGRKNRPGHGKGRPRFKGDEYRVVVYDPSEFPGGQSAGAVRVLDDAAEIALSFLKPGQRLDAHRGESKTPTARWEADETGKVRRVPTF